MSSRASGNPRHPQRSADPLSSPAPDAGGRASARPRLYGVQILRGFAALLVVFHHEVELAVGAFPGVPLPRALVNGAFGVDLFFPISGLVMFLTASSLVRRAAPHTPDWRDFAWRRIVRVVPLYWLATTLKLLLFFAVPSAMAHFRPRPSNILASYLFLPTLGPGHTPLPVLPVGWTLNFEMGFYLVVALTLAFRLPLLRTVTLVLGAISLVGFVLPPSCYAQPWSALAFLVHPIQLEFLFGLFLAALLPRLRSTPIWLPAVTLPAALVFALCYPQITVVFWSPTRPLVWGIPGALILWSVLALERHLPLERQRLLLLLGDASYSVYLSHTFVLPALALLVPRLPLQGPAGLAGFVVLGTLVCLAVGVLVHLYLELPLLAALSRRAPSWSARSAEAS